MKTWIDWIDWQSTFEAIRPFAGAVVGVAVLAFLVYIAQRLLLGRKPRTPEPELTFDVRALNATPPPTDGPSLELYHVPMRLVAVVLSASGRGGTQPSDAEVPELLDHAVPGLAAVVAAQQPLIVCWPGQLSAQGFTHAFFSNVRIPGDQGKGTVWSSVAGRFKVKARRFQAGLLLCAAKPNNFSQILVERENQWLDVLRVRSEPLG